VSGSLPRIVFGGYVNKEYCLAQAMSDGLSLTGYLQKHGFLCEPFQALSRRVVDYLLALRLGPQVSQEVVSDETEDFVRKNIKDCRQYASLDDGEQRRLSSLIKACVPDGGKIGIPRVVQHGDFQPDNILYREDGTFTVLDWEYSLESGLPLIDLLNFLVFGAAYAKRRRAARTSSRGTVDAKTFEECFYRQNATSLSIGRAVKTYCDSLGIDGRARQVLFLIFVFRHLDVTKDALALLFEKGSPAGL
jgi:aminoglycoside phosphotransferase (APT) family kinase protein